MRKVACYIVYNESDFLEASVRSIVRFMDKIIIVEGCHLDYAKYNKSLRSTDGTCEIARHLAAEFHDKIIYVEHNGIDQQAQRNKYVEYLEEGDMFLLVDGDEAYTASSIENIIARYEANPLLDFMAVKLLSVLPDGKSQYIHSGNIDMRYRWTVIRWRVGWAYNSGGAIADQMRLLPCTENGKGSSIFSLPGTQRIYLPHSVACTLHYRFCKTPTLLAQKDSCYSLVREIEYWPEVKIGMTPEMTVGILRVRYGHDWWIGDPFTQPLGLKHPHEISEYTKVRFRNETELFEC